MFYPDSDKDGHRMAKLDDSKPWVFAASNISSSRYHNILRISKNKNKNEKLDCPRTFG
jgi:hypothetical protein